MGKLRSLESISTENGIRIRTLERWSKKMNLKIFKKKGVKYVRTDQVEDLVEAISVRHEKILKKEMQRMEQLNESFYF